MTRFASIMGVAAVATLVLLSGCEQAMDKTDYAKNLEGTWSVTLSDREFPNPMPPPTTFTGMTAVTTMVTRTGTNEGTVSLTTVDTATGVPGSTTTKITGDIEVTATEITVSGIEVDPPAAAAAIPGGAAGLEGLTLTYELSDDNSKLTVGNEMLFPILLGTMEIELTKQMASN